jgi:signal transduction histidine kinase
VKRSTRARSRWRHLPRVSTVAFGVLLVSMTGLTIASTRALQRLGEQRLRVADDAIREYASLGARLFGDRAYSMFEVARTRILSSVYGASLRRGEPALPLQSFVEHARREMDRAGFAVGDSNRGFFRLDASTGQYEGTGSAAPSDVGRRITELIRTRPLPSDPRMEPMAWMMLDQAEPLTIGMATLHDESGHGPVHFGFLYTRRLGWKSVGDAIMRELPLLPGAFIDPKYRFALDASKSDTLVAIRLFDATGRVLYDSRPPFPGAIAGEFRFNTGTGSFRAVETLHPSLLASIRRSLQASHTYAYLEYEMGGEIRRARIPFEIILPLIALTLATLAGVSLWREHRVTRARRDFVASVSHELRTPLAQIRMFTETLLLGRERDAEERTHWLSIIGREARRLGDLVENILLFSHIEAERARLETERTDVGELVEEIVEGYLPIAAQKRMHIAVDAPSRILSMVDPRAMRQIVVNLLDNALKYGPEGQTVRIDLERSEQKAVLTIADEGPGIDVADRKRMWEPFVRLGAQGTTGGSGIGLAVVRDLVTMHDGTITIDDAPGGGARFTIELAISESERGAPTRAHRNRPSSSATAASS